MLFLCAENCLDRHVEEDPNRVALIWEKDEPQQHENITYKYVYKYETDEYPSLIAKNESLWTEHAVCTSVATKKLTFSKSMLTSMYGAYSKIYFLVLEKTYGLSKLWDSSRIYYTKSQLYLPPTMLCWSNDKKTKTEHFA